MQRGRGRGAGRQGRSLGWGSGVSQEGRGPVTQEYTSLKGFDLACEGPAVSPRCGLHGTSLSLSNGVNHACTPKRP